MGKGKRNRASSAEKDKAKKAKNTSNNGNEDQKLPRESNVIKSPLDTNGYSVLELNNGLKTILTSTLPHELDLGEGQVINPRTGAFFNVEEFNRNFIKIPDDELTRLTPEETKMIAKANDCGKGDKNNSSEEPETKRAKLCTGVKKRQSMAAVCITIAAGSLHNPTEFPGLAHICEHACVSFGSVKYPNTNPMAELKSLGGFINACTSYLQTHYFFVLDLNTAGKAGFERALDMLVDNLANPIITKERLAQEVHAVDCEFGLKEANDTLRMWSVICSTAPKGHPMAAFTCGDSSTLANDKLHGALLAWKERHYAANFMSASITADLPLEELTEIAMKYFSVFKPSTLPSPNGRLLQSHGNPFDTKEFNRLYKVFPAEDVDLMGITWIIPNKFAQNQGTKPLDYLESFLGRDSQLAVFFKYFQVAFCMSTRVSQYPFGTTFSILLHLTPQMVQDENPLGIVGIIYEWLKMLTTMKEGKVLAFNELQKQMAEQFHYTGRGLNLTDLLDRTTAVGEIKDPKYILTEQSLMTKFDVDVIDACIQSLTSRNMNVMLCSKQFQAECKYTERWHSTKYTSVEFDEKFLKLYDEAQGSQYFGPSAYKNPFRQLNITCPVRGAKLENSCPIVQDNKLRVNYMKGDLCSPGRIPQGVYLVTIYSPLTKTTGKSFAFGQIWTWMLDFCLSEEFSAAGRAGIMSRIGQVPGQGNIMQMVSMGPPAHQGALLKTMVEIFNKFEKISPSPTYMKDGFEIVKQRFEQCYKNAALNPCSYAQDLRSFLLENKHRLFDQISDDLKGTNVADFEKYVKDFKSKMFIHAVMLGCIEEENAQSATKIIQEGLCYDELPEILSTKFPRAMQLPLGERCLRVKSRNKFDRTSRVINHYQFGIIDPNDQNVQRLVHALQYAAFYQLRTVENLSYAVHVSLRFYCHVGGLEVHVSPQSHCHTTGYVDERIDAFLSDFRKSIPEKEHPNLFELFDKFLLPNDQHFRKLSIQVVGHVNRNKYPECEPIKPMLLEEKIQKAQSAKKSSNSSNSGYEETLPNIELDLPCDYNDKNLYFITDLSSFKHSMPCFPREDY